MCVFMCTQIWEPLKAQGTVMIPLELLLMMVLGSTCGSSARTLYALLAVLPTDTHIIEL